jgi:hypothetical protein
LHPFDFGHLLPATEKHPETNVTVHVAFSLHTFTRTIEAGDPPEDDYADNREKRCFDHDRYRLSRGLPKIVREIPQRPLFYSRTLSGAINYATFETDTGGTYGVYFDVMRYPKRGPDTVLLTIVSAYRLADGKRDTREGRIRFNVLLGHALRGTKPKAPPRAR